MPGSDIQEWNPGLVNHRLDQLEEWRRDMTRIVLEISETLTSLRVMQTESHADREALRATMDRSTAVISQIDERMRDIEAGLPIFRLTSKWVIAGVLGVFALVGVAVVSFVLNQSYHESHLIAQRTIERELMENHAGQP